MVNHERALLIERLRLLKIAVGRAQAAANCDIDADLLAALAEVVVRYEAARRSPWTAWNDAPALPQKERTDG